MNFPILKDIAKMRMFQDSYRWEWGFFNLAMDTVFYMFELDSDCIHKMIQLFQSEKMIVFLWNMFSIYCRSVSEYVYTLW